MLKARLENNFAQGAEGAFEEQFERTEGTPREQFCAGRQGCFRRTAQEFLDKKNKIHQIEDPEFLDGLSEIFDSRNWNLKSFDPANDDYDEIFEKEKTEMIEKFTENTNFFEDVENSKWCFI